MLVDYCLHFGGVALNPFDGCTREQYPCPDTGLSATCYEGHLYDARYATLNSTMIGDPTTNAQWIARAIQMALWTAMLAAPAIILHATGLPKKCKEMVLRAGGAIEGFQRQRRAGYAGIPQGGTDDVGGTAEMLSAETEPVFEIDAGQLNALQQTVINIIELLKDQGENVTGGLAVLRDEYDYHGSNAVITTAIDTVRRVLQDRIVPTAARASLSHFTSAENAERAAASARRAPRLMPDGHQASPNYNHVG